jgi:hypothetical protein
MDIPLQIPPLSMQTWIKGHSWIPCYRFLAASKYSNPVGPTWRSPASIHPSWNLEVAYIDQKYIYIYIHIYSSRQINHVIPIRNIMQFFCQKWRIAKGLCVIWGGRTEGGNQQGCLFANFAVCILRPSFFLAQATSHNTYMSYTGFSFLILWWSWSGNHPQDDLARFLW